TSRGLPGGARVESRQGALAVGLFAPPHPPRGSRVAGRGRRLVRAVARAAPRVALRRRLPLLPLCGASRARRGGRLQHGRARRGLHESPVDAAPRRSHGSRASRRGVREGARHPVLARARGRCSRGGGGGRGARPPFAPPAGALVLLMQAYQTGATGGLETSLFTLLATSGLLLASSPASGAGPLVAAGALLAAP